MNLDKQLAISLSIGLGLTSCFQEQAPPPDCFAIDGEVSFDTRTMALRYQKRSSAYCSYDLQSCLEVWTGLTKQELVQKSEYLVQYPYLALLKKRGVSSDSLYSECYLPLCQSPECECETAQDCSEGSLCVGLGLLGASPQKTRCLNLCDETSTCFGDAANTYCAIDDCLTSNTDSNSSN